MQCLVRPILKYLHGPQQKRQKEWKEEEKMALQNIIRNSKKMT
jgi:hypothetical protein